MALATVLSMLRYVGEIDDRDFVDRLHSYFTTNILIALSIIVSFKQFGGKPMECLIPDIFTSAWEQYAENYCWAQDTYFVPSQEYVESKTEDYKKEKRISYYQWVPFFLLAEAACFRLPSLLWKYMAGYSGIKVHEIVKLASDPNNIKPDIKRANIKSLTVHLQGALRFHRRLQKKQLRPHRYLRIFNMPYTAFFVTSMYILTKLFYLVNVCVQLYVMNRFLETTHYRWYGFGAVMDLLSGHSWEQSGVFPRVSLCDFVVRQMGNIQSFTIQCVLVINIFNEKVFVFLWFWFMMLMVLTALSLVYWMFVSILPQPNRRFINRHLEMSEMAFDPTESEKDVKRFINSYLKTDGLFVIRMLTMHAGVIFGTDLVLSLWTSYFGIEQQLKRHNSFSGRTTLWPPPPDKQVNTVRLGKLETTETIDNQANIVRQRRVIATAKNEPATLKLKDVESELTSLIDPKVEFSIGSPMKKVKETNVDAEPRPNVVHRQYPESPKKNLSPESSPKKNVEQQKGKLYV